MIEKGTRCKLQMDNNDQPQQNLSIVEIAQIALDLGFVPIPLKGKKPFLPQWQKITTQTALRKIESTYKSGSADNIGILTGMPSGVIVVDVDVSRGGMTFWDDLLKDHSLPETLTVETGSGGRHYYFLYDEENANLRNATAAIKRKGIDFKTNGGEVVFAGSIHPETGRMYTIIDGIKIDPQTGGEYAILAQMPSWLSDLLHTNQDELDTRS